MLAYRTDLHIGLLGRLNLVHPSVLDPKDAIRNGQHLVVMGS